MSRQLKYKEEWDKYHKRHQMPQVVSVRKEIRFEEIKYFVCKSYFQLNCEKYVRVQQQI